MKMIKFLAVSTLALMLIENGWAPANAQGNQLKSGIKQELPNDKRGESEVGSTSSNSEKEVNKQPFKEQVAYTSPEKKEGSTNKVDGEVSSPEVNIPDYYLKYSILQALNLPVVGSVKDTPVTQDDLLNLTSLDLSNNSILTSLEGIQYASNLTSLTIISPFSSKIDTNLLSSLYRLTSLTIVGSGTGKISDIEFLKNLTSLKFLNLRQNSITDISPLNYLTNLEQLSLDNCKISKVSVSSLGSLINLTSLKMSYTGVTDYSWITSLNKLEQLSIANNNLNNADVFPIRSLTKLTNVYIQNNNLTDLSSFKNMHHVELLQAERNQISDLTPISEFNSIHQINLSNNNVTDIAPLTKVTATNANYIMLRGNHISDISSLGNLSSSQDILVDATNQTVTLPEIKSYKGDEVRIDNPFKSIDGKVPALNNISPSSGVYDESNKQIVISDNTSANITGEFVYKEWDGHFGFTATVRQPVNLKIHGGSVIVKYEDGEGNKLSEDDVLSGDDGDPYKSSAKSISGWTVKTTPTNAQGTFTQSPQTVTYVYEKAVAMPVSVRYVDDDGNEIAPSDTLTGKYGDPYKSSAKSISGWTVKTTPTNAQGTFTQSPQTVTYVYEKAVAMPVSVKYIDDDGNEIAPSDTLTGKYGDPYKASAKSISGWTVKTAPTNAQGTFTQFPQTVTYVYEKAVAMPVSVRYIDDDGNEIAPSDTLTGKYGDSYKASAKSISGWTVKTAPTNAQGTFTQFPQTVTYVYEKAVAMPVSVRYIDDDGNEIAPSDTLTGKYGDSYKASAKSISGWTVKTTPTNAQGTFTQSPQTVTYVYDRKSETKIMQDKGSGSNSIHQTSNTNSYRKSLLPQTGESSSANLLMVGSILNFLTLIFLFIARKIKKY